METPKNTVFIAIEGPDQAGKTFHAKRLVDVLINSYNVNAVYYHLPDYNIDTGKVMSQYLMGTLKLSTPNIKALYQINRTLTFQEIVNNNLGDIPTIYVGDRDMISTAIYQGVQQALDGFNEIPKETLKGHVKILTEHAYDDPTYFHPYRPLSQTRVDWGNRVSTLQNYIWECICNTYTEDRDTVDQIFNDQVFLLDVSRTLQKKRLKTRSIEDQTGNGTEGDVHERNRIFQSILRYEYGMVGSVDAAIDFKGPMHQDKRYQSVGPVKNDDTVVDHVIDWLYAQGKLPNKN